jgi:anti-sigma-K factor RskA
MTNRINDQMNEETLILYYYNDGLTEDERRDVATALREDETMRRRYEALTRDLDALREQEDLPVPEGLEYRLQSALDRAVRLEETGPQRESWLQRLFAPRLMAAGTALVAVLAVGIGIGIWMAGGETPIPQVVIQTPPETTATWSQTAFQRGLESHFRSGRSNLASLSQQPEQDREALFTSLIAQNRLYEKLAIENDSPELARVLRSFEPVLLELASEDLTAEELTTLKSQLEFRFEVMLTKLGRDSSQQTVPHNQEIEL